MNAGGIDTPLLDAAIQRILGRGDMATSAVLVADSPAGVVERAYGTRHDDRPAGLTDLHNLYCATKPAFAVTLLSLMQEGRLALDDRVDKYLQWTAGHWIGALTVEDLLTHNNNMHRVGAIVPVIAEPTLRGQVLKQLPEEPLEGTRGYSDFGGWFLLAHIAEVATGQDYRDLNLAYVNERYDIPERELNLGIPPELFDEWLPDISFNLYSRGETARHPLAAEGASIWACDWNAPNSGYGSARGLVAFYKALLADVRGAGRALQPDMAQRAVTPGDTFDDQRLQHPASYGLGLMVNMPLFRLGPAPSPSSFGHVGVGGGALGFVDPEHDLVVAIVFNVVFDEAPDLLVERGNAISALYADLGLRELDPESAQ